METQKKGVNRKCMDCVAEFFVPKGRGRPKLRCDNCNYEHRLATRRAGSKRRKGAKAAAEERAQELAESTLVREEESAEVYNPDAAEAHDDENSDDSAPFVFNAPPLR